MLSVWTSIPFEDGILPRIFFGLSRYSVPDTFCWQIRYSREYFFGTCEFSITITEVFLRWIHIVKWVLNNNLTPTLFDHIFSSQFSKLCPYFEEHNWTKLFLKSEPENMWTIKWNLILEASLLSFFNDFIYDANFVLIFDGKLYLLI